MGVLQLPCDIGMCDCQATQAAFSAKQHVIDTDNIAVSKDAGAPPMCYTGQAGLNSGGFFHCSKASE